MKWIIRFPVIMGFIKTDNITVPPFFHNGTVGKFANYILGCAIAFFGAAILIYIMGFDEGIMEVPWRLRMIVK